MLGNDQNIQKININLHSCYHVDVQCTCIPICSCIYMCVCVCVLKSSKSKQYALCHVVIGITSNNTHLS